MGYSYGYCVHRCTGFLDIQHRLGDASATSLCNDASSPLLQRIAAHLKWGSLHPGAFSKLISAVWAISPALPQLVLIFSFDAQITLSHCGAWLKHHHLLSPLLHWGAPFISYLPPTNSTHCLPISPASAAPAKRRLPWQHACGSANLAAALPAPLTRTWMRAGYQ